MPTDPAANQAYPLDDRYSLVKHLVEDHTDKHLEYDASSETLQARHQRFHADTLDHPNARPRRGRP